MSEEKQEMSAVGQELWVEMQVKGPYNRTDFAELLTERWNFPTTHQSVSNYLRREHPPAKFVAVALKALDVGEEKRRRIYDLYFEGSAANDPRITPENRARAEEYMEQIEHERQEQEDNSSG
jgi:hypothetical protein